MKAIIWTEYGPPDVLQIRDIAKPKPKDNEVLIKIYTTTVTAGDCEQRSLKLPFWLALPIRAYMGFVRPKRITILGMDLAGEVEAFGKDVKRFKKGDQVFAATGFINMGSYAEYICLPEEPEEGALELKPTNMTYEEAATVPTGGLEALHFLRKANIQNGQKVLINGAGGTIGTFAVQLSKYFGAEVTGVDSMDKLDMLESIGADHVIDYTQEDFTKSDETYDVIFDVVGKSSFSGSIRLLKKNGCYLIANPRLSQMVRGRWTSLTDSKQVIFGAANLRTENLLFLKELIEAKKIVAVIDRYYPLERIVEAHRYVESGQKKGQVVITLNHNAKN
jgi:NADPH:quinone reductase-like Zn-dependent oxidoreductase